MHSNLCTQKFKFIHIKFQICSYKQCNYCRHIYSMLILSNQICDCNHNTYVKRTNHILQIINNNIIFCKYMVSFKGIEFSIYIYILSAY